MGDPFVADSLRHAYVWVRRGDTVEPTHLLAVRKRGRRGGTGERGSVAFGTGVMKEIRKWLHMTLRRQRAPPFY
jgi:hypothetical protein